MIMLFTALHESGIGTKRTCRADLTMSVDRSKAEVVETALLTYRFVPSFHI
jgi:hypothetical protein